MLRLSVFSHRTEVLETSLSSPVNLIPFLIDRFLLMTTMVFLFAYALLPQSPTPALLQ